MLSLVKEAKVSSAITPTAGAAGTTAIEGSIIDMANFENVAAIVRLGAIVTGAVTSLKWRQGDASNLSDATDLVGSAMTIADDDDGEIIVTELIKPTKRYAQLYVSRATQNATIAAAEYIQYGARTIPVTQPTGTTVESHVSPVAGTA